MKIINNILNDRDCKDDNDCSILDDKEIE